MTTEAAIGESGPTPLEEADRPGVTALLTAAFDGPLEARLVDRFWADEAIIAERAIVNDQGPVAYAVITPVRIEDGKGASIDAMGLAPVATAPAHQRQGYGSRVVRAVIDAAFAMHPDRALFVLGEPAYYKRFGFTPAAPHGLQWEGGPAGDAFQVMAPRDGALISTDAVRLVRYCDAFQIFNEPDLQ